MSMPMMVDAIKTTVGNPLRKLVLIKLAENANNEGECWPSFKHVADQCEISRRSVIYHIQALEKAGFLTVIHRRKTGSSSHSNCYQMALKCGAGDSLGSATDAPSSAGDAPPSAGDAPSGSAGDSPRISHSFESVTEPVSEQCASGDAPARNPAPEPETETQQQSNPEPDPPKHLTEDEFKDFWAKCRSQWYGRPGAPAEARAEFKKIKRNDITPERLTELALEDCKIRWQEYRQQGFAPNMKNANRWLKNRCWEAVEESPVGNAAVPERSTRGNETDDYVASAMAQSRRSVA